MHSPPSSPNSIALLTDPHATQTTVAYPASAALAPYTDPYFRGFDNAFPDYYRYKEWEREFDTKYAKAGGEELPALSLVRFMHDHTGNFGTAIDGVNTPELQQADNDYAVGLLVEKISKSRYANDTLIFVIEDDAQDGGDHVDSHRSVAFVAGAYVKQGALVSTQYNTINFLRTIEEVLGLPPMNLNDALARPMADIFNTTPSPWSFTAAPAPILYRTTLPLPPKPVGLIVPKPTHDAKYWARVTEGMDFTSEDRFDFARLQPHSLERDDGQQALSRRADRNGPAPEPRGTPRALPAVSEPRSGAGIEGTLSAVFHKYGEVFVISSAARNLDLLRNRSLPFGRDDTEVTNRVLRGTLRNQSLGSTTMPKMKQFVLMAALLAFTVALSTPGAAGAAGFNQFIGFGDSTLDTGYFRYHTAGNAAFDQAIATAIAHGATGGFAGNGVMNTTILAGKFGLSAAPVGGWRNQLCQRWRLLR